MCLSLKSQRKKENSSRIGKKLKYCFRDVIHNEMAEITRAQAAITRIHWGEKPNL